MDKQFDLNKKYVFDEARFLKARKGHDKEGDRLLAKKYDGAPVRIQSRFYGSISTKRGKRDIKVVPKWCREEN